MAIIIREAGKPDFEPIGIIFAEENRFHAELLPDIFQVAEPVMTQAWFDAVLADPLQRLFAAWIGGDVVGVILLQEMANPDDVIYRPRRYLYVDELMVAGSFRRRGIGRRLMEEAERWARERGLEEIELNVWELNPSAIAFYESLGYEPVRRRMRRRTHKPPKFSQNMKTSDPIEGEGE